METEKGILAVVGICATVLVIIMATFAGCTVHSNHCTLEAIKYGVPPITASKAFSATGQANDSTAMAEIMGFAEVVKKKVETSGK